MTRKILNVDLSQERLERHGWTITDTGCWEWAGNTFHTFGYGQLRILGKGYDAHRLAYRTWVQWEIPEGAQVRHTCDNPPCINPAHLILGSSQDNHDDMVLRGRALRGERNPAAKLTDDDTENIRIVWGLGASQGKIAKAFGVGQPTISHIVNNKRRKV